MDDLGKTESSIAKAPKSSLQYDVTPVAFVNDTSGEILHFVAVNNLVASISHL